MSDQILRAIDGLAREIISSHGTDYAGWPVDIVEEIWQRKLTDLVKMALEGK